MRHSPKVNHEVRCPIHGFIRFNNLERRLIDSLAMQRLKHIHQLAMTYQVYPGATHRRFEHSLGVMDLAGRAFDSLMQPEKQEWGAISMPEATDLRQREYWKQVVRLAALLHDVGHLPFSHAAEEQLLPADWSHETLTRELILHSEIAEILNGADVPYRPEDVVKLALEPKEQSETDLTPWEALLNELITGATFGVDRMDYLLRDSHHAGVPYGRFDPFRLLDSLVIVQPPEPPAGGNGPELPEPAPDMAGLPHPGAGSGEQRRIGVYQGGIHGVEALLVARFFMFTQLYFHDVRRAYDVHLIDFLKALFPKQSYPTESSRHLAITYNDVLISLRQAATDPGHPGHEPARRIHYREHFRTAYTFKRTDLRIAAGGPEVVNDLCAALQKQFGTESVRVDAKLPKQNRDEVFVLLDDGEVVSGRAESDLLSKIPNAWFAYVFCASELVEQVSRFVRRILN